MFKLFSIITVILLPALFVLGCDNNTSSTTSTLSSDNTPEIRKSLIHPKTQMLEACPVSLTNRFEVHMQIFGQADSAMPLLRIKGQDLGTPSESLSFTFDRNTGPDDAVWHTDKYTLVFSKDQLPALAKLELHHDTREGYQFYYLEGMDE